MHTYASDHTAIEISLLWISVLVSLQQNFALLFNKLLSVFVLSSVSGIATQCNGTLLRHTELKQRFVLTLRN